MDGIFLYGMRKKRHNAFLLPLGPGKSERREIKFTLI
jgi:hypothetical protein